MCSEQIGIGAHWRDREWIETIRDRFRRTGAYVHKKEFIAFDLIDHLQDSDPGSMVPTLDDICYVCMGELRSDAFTFDPAWRTVENRYRAYCSAQCFVEDLGFDDHFDYIQVSQPYDL